MDKSELTKKILTLEWDKKRHQLNFAKEGLLKKYKEELEQLRGSDER